MVIFIPPDETFDATENVFLAAGAKVLQFDLEIAM
jgi:hypothetical protein